MGAVNREREEKVVSVEGLAAWLTKWPVGLGLGLRKDGHVS